MGIFKKAYENDKKAQEMYFYWLSSTNLIGIKTYTAMQSYYPSPRDVFDAGPGSWEKTGVFTKTQIAAMSAVTVDSLKDGFESMHKKGIRHIPWESDEYPERLKNIPRPPAGLFVKGDLRPDPPLSVAVIGTRECSVYGTQVAKAVGEALAVAGITLVSGMARGIDSLSQIAATEAGGYSVAVLGGGCDIVYPRESYGLYKDLVRNGCVVSEFAPGTEPHPKFFALRNRIISGLSDVVLVVEARQKSGTMITVDSALEQGREVYAVPGRITDRSSRGCHELIRQGAGIVCDPEEFVKEIMENYGIVKENDGTSERVPKPGGRDLGMCDENERRIIDAIGSDSMVLEEIGKASGLGFEGALTAMEGLMQKGIVKNLGAGRFALEIFNLE